MLIRTRSSCTYNPLDRITSAWVTNCWLIGASTHVLSPSIATNVSVIKPNIVTTELEPSVAIQATYTYLSEASAMEIMDPYEAEALV